MGEEAQELEETSLTDDIAAAWPEDDDLTLAGAHDQEETDGTGEIQRTESDTDTESAERGREADTKAEADTETVSGDQQATEKQRGKDAQGELAPVGLSAEAREAWKDTPKAVQAAVAKREKDFAVGIQKYAEAANRSHQMDAALRPHQQFFATQGQPPAQTIGVLLQTASVLQMGTPQQKAQTMVDLFTQFGVDIPAVDALLTGKDVPPEQQQQNHVQSAVQEAMAPFQNMMQGFQNTQQSQQDQVAVQAGDEVTSFGNDAANEFYNDVKMDMADIIDMSINRGIELTLKQAYDKACMLNPEIQRVVQSRVSTQNLQSKRKASSSVSGGMGGPGDNSAPDSVRGAIEDAWDNAGRT